MSHNHSIIYIHTLICFLTISLYVEEQLGRKYVEKRTIPFEESYKETGPATPVFFVLSPGVDPLKDVEAVGRKLGFTLDSGNFHNVSLGQVCQCIYIHTYSHDMYIAIRICVCMYMVILCN